MGLGLRVGDRSWGEEKEMSLDDASTRDPGGRSIPFLSPHGSTPHVPAGCVAGR